MQLHAHDKPGCEISKTPMTRREKRCRVPLRPFHNPRSSVARHNNLGSQRKASLQEESAVRTRNMMLNAIKTNLYCLHCLPPQPTYVSFLEDSYITGFQSRTATRSSSHWPVQFQQDFCTSRHDQSRGTTFPLHL